MNKEEEYIGRSNIAIPTEKNEKEIHNMYAYANHYTWREQSNYYTLSSNRSAEHYLGFHHTPTGVLMALRCDRSNNTVTDTLYSDGNILTKGSWKALPTINNGSPEYNHYQKFLATMDSMDSDRMNWNVVSMSFKDEFANNRRDFHLFDGEGYFAKLDLSYLFEVTHTLQVGFKNTPDDGIYFFDGEKAKQIEKENKMKEMII